MKRPTSHQGSVGVLAVLAGLLFLQTAGTMAAAGSESGEARLDVIGTVRIDTPCIEGSDCRPLYREASVRGWLRSQLGKPFDRDKALRKIQRHYMVLGFDSTVSFDFQAPRLDIHIIEAPGVVASVAVDQKALNAFVPRKLTVNLKAVERPHVPMSVLRAQEGSLINRGEQARDEYDLSLLGYDIVEAPAQLDGDGHRYFVTRRPRLGRWNKVRDEVQEEARAAGNDDADPLEPAIGPFQKRWVSGSAEYSRRDLFIARLFYQRAHYFREFDLLEFSPYVTRKLAGAVRYRQDFILPASVTSWNLFGEVKLYDEFTPDRLLDGVATDEERVGGRLTLGLEPFRHWKGHSLKGWGYVDRYHLDFGEFAIPLNGSQVRRSTQVIGAEINDINLLGLSFEYFYRHVTRAPSFWIAFRPTAELTTEAWGGDIAFRRVKGEIQQHYSFASGFEIDMRWKAGLVDRSVPIFEEFALGGADSLRGFLRDDFLGRKFFTAQQDLWIPIHFTAMGRNNSFLKALERNLKTAITFDVGSVSVSDVLDVRVARGIGLGLVYSAESSPLVVRAEAAWGYWEGETRWYPYLSFSRKW